MKSAVMQTQTVFRRVLPFIALFLPALDLATMYVSAIPAGVSVMVLARLCEVVFFVDFCAAIAAQVQLNTAALLFFFQ